MTEINEVVETLLSETLLEMSIISTNEAGEGKNGVWQHSILAVVVPVQLVVRGGPIFRPNVQPT